MRRRTTDERWAVEALARGGVEREVVTHACVCSESRPDCPSQSVPEGVAVKCLGVRPGHVALLDLVVYNVEEEGNKVVLAILGHSPKLRRNFMPCGSVSCCVAGSGY